VGDDVVSRYFAQLQPPTLDEGFAEVVYVPDETGNGDEGQSDH
jgi:hypothetical protein